MNGLIISIASQTLLQEHTTDETRGKVFEALYDGQYRRYSANSFAGILADLIGVAHVVTILGLLLLVFAVGQVYWLRHQGSSLKDS